MTVPVALDALMPNMDGFETCRPLKDNPAGSDASERLREQFSLTAREAEVMLWIANGKTNREIGQILEMSPRTVNKHLEQVFRKLGVENRTAAAAIRCLSRFNG